MRLRIVVADDHQLMRDGLSALAESGVLGEVEVVAQAADIAETGRAVREHSPDLLLLDLRMPGGSCVDLVRELTHANPSLKVLVLTSYEETAFARATLAAGAAGYLLKRSAHSELAAAIKSLRAGRIFIDPSLRSDLSGGNVQGTQGLEKLTPREREVLVLLARGLTYNEVGKRLHIGARTVETHRRKVAEKLGIENRADLLRLALEFGLIRPGDVERGEPPITT